jgi:hypothetical protein
MRRPGFVLSVAVLCMRDPGDQVATGKPGMDRAGLGMARAGSCKCRPPLGARHRKTAAVQLAGAGRETTILQRQNRFSEPDCQSCTSRVPTPDPDEGFSGGQTGLRAGKSYFGSPKPPLAQPSPRPGTEIDVTSRSGRVRDRLAMPASKWGVARSLCAPNTLRSSCPCLGVRTTSLGIRTFPPRACWPSRASQPCPGRTFLPPSRP